MFNNIPIEKIFRTALSSGGEFAELYAERTVLYSILHENKKLERVNVGADTGYGLRVLFGDRSAYGFTNEPDKLFDLAATIGKGQKAGKPAGQTIKYKDRRTGIKGEEDKETLQQAAGKHLVGLVNRAASEAWKHDNIRQVQVTWRSTKRRISIVNSKGLLVNENRLDSVMLVLVIVEKDGIIQTGYEPAGGSVGIEYFLHETPEKIAKAAAERALLMLRANHSPRGVMPVVISSSAGGTIIHEAVGHGLESDLVRQGMSVYKDKIGKKVASSLITVIDDATLPSKRGSSKFDDEGAPAQKTILIENGILKTYLHNHITAAAAGVKSTGNGRRESYRNRPVVRMTNTMVASGKDDPKSILASVKNGLFIKKMGGGQVNTVNGDFVFEAQEAYLIENGRIALPVRGATIIGNGPKVLMEIDMVGTDLGFGIGTCGKEGQGVPVGHGMPTIRIPEITIGGTG